MVLAYHSCRVSMLSNNKYTYVRSKVVSLRVLLTYREGCMLLHACTYVGFFTVAGRLCCVQVCTPCKEQSNAVLLSIKRPRIQSIFPSAPWHLERGFLDSCHRNFPRFEDCHYNSSYWKIAITILDTPVRYPHLRIRSARAHCQAVGCIRNAYGRRCPSSLSL